MAKILVIGSGGQLGRDFVIEAAANNHDVIGIDFPDIDICDITQVESHVKNLRPDVIVNCAAFTAVDDCESMTEKAFALNADACGNLAITAKKYSARLVHFSTDYVFDGQAQTPYIETSATNPQSIYGKSKLRGEEFIAELCDDYMIFRIAWLYGEHGNNFVKTILRLAKTNAESQKPLRVVNDQTGSPTWTIDVCKQVLATLPSQERGIFHATSEGSCTWFDFAKAIVAAAKIDVQVLPCTTAEFPRPAPRPIYSVLENARLKKIGANIMPNWDDTLAIFMERLNEK